MARKHRLYMIGHDNDGALVFGSDEFRDGEYAATLAVARLRAADMQGQFCDKVKPPVIYKLVRLTKREMEGRK